MNGMEMLGYAASLIIGISLGLIGGGGSILAVPVLVYLFNVSPLLATSYSLFIVGTTSLVGAIPKYREGLINLKTAVIFGVPAIAVVFITRRYLLPAIPEEIFTSSGFVLTKNLMLMLVFAVLMIVAAISMIRKKETEEQANGEAQQFNYPLILVEGALVGVLTGLVGAGGGFLIIPALVLLSKLPMKQAVGTSLLIIAAKSLIGFTGDIFNYQMNWPLLLFVTAVAVAGIFAGNYLNKMIPSGKLKIGFGWFVLVMGIYIITKELFLG